MKRLFNSLLILGALVGAVYGVGLIVPRTRVLTAKALFAEGPVKVFAALNDPGTWPDWHPGVASVQERPDRNDHAVWRILSKEGTSFELEVLQAEEDRSWQATYTIEGERTTWRVDMTFAGSGGARILANRTIDTRDPWMRAKGFFLPGSDLEPIAFLNALGAHFGESVKAEAK